ncbi:MAG: hypothetical protein EXR29_08725 [Betaproteobacteria bacterium]|nr:hypothetical protein [Betaproteobacteria bacterium]
MRLTTDRADGKIGKYVQNNARRAHVLARRLDPLKLFCSGPIVIGELNPFTILNPDELCWVEAQSSGLLLYGFLPDRIEQVRKLAGRDEYEGVLARQWPRWRKKKSKGVAGDLLEALVELSFRGGHVLHLHLLGRVVKRPLAELIFGAPSITASFEPNGMLCANPKCVVRARVYHSMSEVPYPDGLWCAEADEI